MSDRVSFSIAATKHVRLAYGYQEREGWVRVTASQADAVEFDLDDIGVALLRQLLRRAEQELGTYPEGGSSA